MSEFAPVSCAEWEEQIRKDLGGADYAERLLWRTGEGITVRPFYRGEDVPALANPPGMPRGWRISEEIEVGDDPAAARKRADAGGAEEICYCLRSPDGLCELLDGLRSPVHFRAGQHAPAVLAAVRALRPDLSGSLDGAEPDSSLGPRFRTVAVRADAFAERGATVSQQLGCALAEGVEYLAGGDEAANCLTFLFSVGPNYFFEIAKFRAARVLWKQVLEAFGVEAAMHLQARTASWNLARRDPYLNLLRGATEAMAAAIGGADLITVQPYAEGSEHARRMARNTQLLMRHEAHLEREPDPAAGSYYLEWLTDAVAEAAWSWFQRIETAGGFARARGLIEEAVARAAVTRGDPVLVGENKYVEPSGL